MKKITSILVMTLAAPALLASTRISSPSGSLVVTVDADADGTPYYTVDYRGREILGRSPLGFRMADGMDFTYGLGLESSVADTVRRSFGQDRIKRSRVDWHATHQTTTFKGADGREMGVEWEVADNDIAFRYIIPAQGEKRAAVIERENTAFCFPEGSKITATPQSDPMIGWKRTKPSYEEFHIVEAPLDQKSQYGHGFTFPVLFNVGGEGDAWVLLNETGVDGYYCGSRLGDFDGPLFSIEYPMPEENNGNGTAAPGIALPGKTPWRTITVGETLAPVVETVVPWSVVEPRYEVAEPARPGKGTWSWLLWQDGSINYDDQVKFIDLAAEMGYDNVLVDNWWDRNIGRDRMADLIKYARSKGVNVILWYSSSGHWNDIEQSPVNHMDRPVVRKKEMKWLRDNGVRNIKVDFFGGDKQETMRLYEDILSDAADYGIDVIFHGCTLPRGWERMYPNFVGAEAALASENLVFSQDFCDLEANQATLYPFMRNAVASLEFGGTVLNRRLNKGNDGGSLRRTGDAFQLATAVLYQNPVQNFALAPNNLTDAPVEAIEFMKEVPTTWDDIRFIDGYPGRYVVMARRHGSRWYVAAVNAMSEPVEVMVDLAALGTSADRAVLYTDTSDLQKLEKKVVKVKGGKLKLKIVPNGGSVTLLN